MATIGLITYQDASRREDLIDVITNVSPRDTPLLNMLQRGPDAKQTLHEYPTATFAAAADNAQSESRAFSAPDHTQPARATNNTQILDDDIQVSGTEAAVNVAGIQGAFEYQITKNLVEHAKDIELALMAGSRASGDSGVARRLLGIINAITTNASTRASGGSLGEVIFNDIMQQIYDSTDYVADEVFVGGTLKRDISGFAGRGGLQFTLDAERNFVPRTVDVYESDFGIHNIHLHRNVPNGANARTLVAIRKEFWAIAWLQGRGTKVERLSKDGDRERAQVISELTIEHRGEATGAAHGGFTG